MFDDYIWVMYWMLRAWDCCPSKDRITQQPTVLCNLRLLQYGWTWPTWQSSALCRCFFVIYCAQWLIKWLAKIQSIITVYDTVYSWCAVDVLKLLGDNYWLSFQSAAIFFPSGFLHLHPIIWAAVWLFNTSLDRMASLERKQQFFSLITQQRNPLIRTSAEIVSEARRSLRVRSTQRPFTPAIATRELFGNKDCTKKRPPSTFRSVTHFDNWMNSKSVLSNVTF